MSLRIIVLGAGAGGGFPQWNSASSAAVRARNGDPCARPATQCSLAVCADGRHWVLLDASPDLGHQIARTPALHPREAPRSTPIAAVLVTGADVDHIAGLLTLREREAFSLYAGERVHRVLADNSVFDVLARDVVPRERLQPNERRPLSGSKGQFLGLNVELFPVPGKVPLYLEDPKDNSGRLGTVDGDVMGAAVDDGRSRFFYVPGCAALTDQLSGRLRGADTVFFDATLWRDDELIRCGAGEKTGARMGHMSMAGPQGSMAAFRDLGVGRKIAIHMNDTNPLLLADSAERAAAVSAGWTVAYDGMELSL